jgi:hypothetical protein
MDTEQMDNRPYDIVHPGFENMCRIVPQAKAFVCFNWLELESSSLMIVNQVLRCSSVPICFCHRLYQYRAFDCIQPWVS